MTQLTFTQDADNMWVATATVNGDFAIHLERETPGYVAVDLTTVENKAYQHLVVSQLSLLPPYPNTTASV